jgi:hypothetical protein
MRPLRRATVFSCASLRNVTPSGVLHIYESVYCQNQLGTPIKKEGEEEKKKTFCSKHQHRWLNITHLLLTHIRYAEHKSFIHSLIRLI